MYLRITGIIVTILFTLLLSETSRGNTIPMWSQWIISVLGMVCGIGLVAIKIKE